MMRAKIRDFGYIAFDLEASYSKKVGFHEIIEIGAYKIEKQSFKITESFTTLVRPAFRISRIISQKTRITDQMVRTAPLVTEIWEKFLQFIESSILVSYHSIDYSILKRTAEYYNLKTIENPYIDLLRIARKLYPNEPSYSLDHFKRVVGISLASHRADKDAFVTAMLFKHFVEILEQRYDIDRFDDLFALQRTNILIQKRLF